jgi:ribonuclease HI
MGKAMAQHPHMGLTKDKEKSERLYTDGSTIKDNPSQIGGSWSACLVTWDGTRIMTGSGTLTPKQVRLPLVTNNVMEIVAVIAGLKRLPPDWNGVVFSDSEITLGRVFQGWQTNGIPDWLFSELVHQQDRLINWDTITGVLVGSHPTKVELLQGFSHKGLPVSIHNVWCDQECQKLAAARGGKKRSYR